MLVAGKLIRFADIILFLTTEYASFVTGASWVADGSRSIV